MAFTVSPGVVTREIDLTAIVPEAGTTAGAFAGAFIWGPIEDITKVSSEDDLVSKFQKPNSTTYNSFFTAANFLSYGNDLNLVRVANTLARNATSNTTNAVLIKNKDSYLNTYDSTYGGTPNTAYGEWAAKYAGVLGNSLKVSICSANKPQATLTGTVSSNSTIMSGTSTTFDTEVSVGDVIYIAPDSFLVTGITNSTELTVQTDNANVSVDAGNTAIRLVRSAFSESTTNMIGTVTVAANSTTVTGTDTNFSLQVNVGDILTIGGQQVAVNSVTNAESLTLVSPITNAASNLVFSRTWEYASSVDTAPTNTLFAERRNMSSDEVHVVVVDAAGEWTGTKGQVLETFSNLSVASDAKAEDGTNLYYKEAINRQSKYIWWMNHPTGGSANATLNTAAWGTVANSAASAGSYQTDGIIVTNTLTGGVDGSTLTDGNIITGFDLFKNAEQVDISLIPVGNASSTVATHVINNIAEVRKDCMVFVSPEQADVVNNIGSEAADTVDFRNVLPSTSYAVLDSGYKYQYDKYNDVYRYVPLNGDMAGLVVRTALERDFFFSPAGFERGQVKNVTKIPFNPDKTDRDTLYKNGINPVVSFPGQGTILFGDKTLLSKPSAFDRINVRRLFIVLEKSISRFAQSQLFEFNDEFTRARFVSTVEPFLRDIQGRGGITDFAVVCDDTNNTADVIERNEFVGSIFVKPTRSINFILLNFVAVRSGVEFNEVTNVV